MSDVKTTLARALSEIPLNVMYDQFRLGTGVGGSRLTKSSTDLRRVSKLIEPAD